MIMKHLLHFVQNYNKKGQLVIDVNAKQIHKFHSIQVHSISGVFLVLESFW